MSGMASRRGNGFSLAVMAGILAVLVLLVVVSLVGLFAAQQDDIAQSRQALALYRGEIASRAALETDLERLGRQEKTNPLLLRGGNASLASADLQEQVKAVVARHGGQIRSVQELPPSLGEGLEKDAIVCELSVPMGGLEGLLYDLETQAPLLFISDASFETVDDWQAGGKIGPVPNVRIHWTIQGYRWAAS